LANIPAFRLLLITDRKRSAAPLPQMVEAALSSVPPGAVAIQLREKDLDARPLLELARGLQPICRAHQAPLLVNDRIDVALALDLDGVHLPQVSFKADDARGLLGPTKLIGVSCHSIAEVRDAIQRGANYATFGPLFETPSKRDFGPPLGLERLGEAAQAALPLYGLGGVTAINASEVRRSGAFGVAAIGAWLDGMKELLPSTVKALLGSD
jgi:thiamine-phosphate pyrophosphorylase